MTTSPFTAEHEMFRKTVRDWAENELLPHQKEWEVAHDVPRSVFKRAGDLGFFGVTYPEAVGGAGGGLVVQGSLL